MSDWKGHLSVAGVVTGVLTAVLMVILFYFEFTEYFWLDQFYGVPLEFIYGIPIGLYCGILPDVDIRTSKAYGLTAGIALILIMAFTYFAMDLQVYFLCILLLVILGMRHRGYMHYRTMSILIGIIFGFAFMSPLVGAYAFAGYLSHTGVEKHW